MLRDGRQKVAIFALYGIDFYNQLTAFQPGNDHNSSIFFGICIRILFQAFLIQPLQRKRRLKGRKDLLLFLPVRIRSILIPFVAVAVVRKKEIAGKAYGDIVRTAKGRA